MLEQVENKILELKQLQAEEYYKKKDADLQAWGLTYKTDGNKVTPIIVTDEEYEALIKASNGVDKIGRNPYARMLNVLAYASAVIGFIAGVVVAVLSENLAFVYFTLCLITGIVIAVIFKGISEAIRLLQQIIDSKPNEKPEGMPAKAPKQTAPAQKTPQQPPVYQQVHIQTQPQPQQAVYQPVYTQPYQQGGPTIYTQQQPVYVYQPQQTQPAQQTDFSYSQKK